MAKNVSARKGNVKNKRSHSLRATLTKQNLNLQEIRTSRKMEKAA